MTAISWQRVFRAAVSALFAAGAVSGFTADWYGVGVAVFFGILAIAPAKPEGSNQ